MTLRSVARTPWQRRSLLGLLGLVALAPAFAWAADRTGYTEPMTHAAALAGVTADAAPTGPSLLSGYALPAWAPTPAHSPAHSSGPGSHSC